MPPSSTITRPSMDRPMLIVSGEMEPLAKAKMPPATPHKQNAADDEHKREKKEFGKPIEWRARPDAEHAIGAAGKLLPLEHDRPDDLGEGEREHREIDAGQPDREPAEQQ